MNREFEKYFRKIEFWLLILAMILGLLAAAVGYPTKAGSRSTAWIELKEINGQQIPVVDVLDLALWIMEKRGNFLVFDLRAEEKFMEYHIPSARRIDAEKAETDLPSDRRVIIYTESGSITPKDWDRLFGIYGEKLHLLLGGVRKWAGMVLFPDLVRKSRLSESDLQRRKQISLFFGGRPQLPSVHQKGQGLIYLREGC